LGCTVMAAMVEQVRLSACVCGIDAVLQYPSGSSEESKEAGASNLVAAVVEKLVRVSACVRQMMQRVCMGIRCNTCVRHKMQHVCEA